MTAATAGRPASELPPVRAPARAAVSQRHAVRDLLLQFIGRVGNLVLGAIVAVAIARALGVDGNGKWTTLIAISTVAGFIVDPGMQATVVRMTGADQTDEAAWMGALVALRTVTGLITALASVIVIALVSRGHTMLIAGLIVTVTSLTSPLSALSVVFQMEVRNDRAIWFITLQSVLWTGATCLLWIVHAGLIPFAIAFTATTVLGIVAQSVYVLKRWRVDLSGVRRYGRRLLLISLPLGISGVLTISYGKIDQVLVLHYVGDRGAGLYGVASSLLDRVQFLPIVLMTTVFPIVAASWPSDPARTRRIVQRTLSYMAILSSAALAFTLGAARPLLELLFGAAFAPAAGALKVLMVSFLLICLGYVTGYLTFVVGRQKLLMVVALAGLVFNLAGNVVLLPRYGFLAAAWMTVATEVVVLVPALIISLRPLGVRPDPVHFARIAVAATIMGLIVAGAHRLGCGILLLVPIAAVVYPLAALATQTLSPEDYALLAGKLRRRRPGA